MKRVPTRTPSFIFRVENIAIYRKEVYQMDKKKKKMYAATLALAFTGYMSPIIGWIDALGGNVIVPVAINVAIAAIVGSILIRMIEDL